jgi:hypothetical protein
MQEKVSFVCAVGDKEEVLNLLTGGIILEKALRIGAAGRWGRGTYTPQGRMDGR